MYEYITLIDKFANAFELNATKFMNALFFLVITGNRCMNASKLINSQNYVPSDKQPIVKHC